MNDSILNRIVGLAKNEIRALKGTLDDDMRKRIRLIMNLEEHQLEDQEFYTLLTNHYNSETALNLIRLCAPIVFSARNLTISVETWNKKTLAINYDEDDKEQPTNYNNVVRLFISPLEILFKCAPFEEVRSTLAYLIDETKRLVIYDTSNWKECCMEKCA